MPGITLNAKRLKTNTGNNLKILLNVSCYMLIVASLSACSAVGFSKPAALQVTSKPEASVFLDGKHIGKTPFYSDQLRAGEFTLKVTVSGADYVDKITLSQGTLAAVNRELNSNYLAQGGENLSLVSGQKGLFIISFPSEADVTIDGSYVGKTPLLTQEIEEGDHKILLAKEGYIEREFAIKSSTKYQVLAEVTLASQIAKGVGTVAKGPQKPQTQHVLILSTPQGFLRVREEPSLSAGEIGQVNSGEEYEIIQEAKEWFQINFDNKIGWVSAVYAQKVE